MLGDISVGKSSLATRFAHEDFSDTVESTIGGFANQFIYKIIYYKEYSYNHCRYYELLFNIIFIDIIIYLFN